MIKKITISYIIIMICLCTVLAKENPKGFQNAPWGSSPAQVQTATQAPGWQQQNLQDNNFPPELQITVFSSQRDIAGYPAEVFYYFYQNKFFQATIKFDFNRLKTFDVNFNVYKSVDKYYKEIHKTTLGFTKDVYALLRSKYGKKRPVFKGLDPRYVLQNTDSYLRQEKWNLRYHPFEYYKRIKGRSYARWDFPKTRIIFSIDIDADASRFDYFLSFVSLDDERVINKIKKETRSSGF